MLHPCGSGQRHDVEIVHNSAAVHPGDRDLSNGHLVRRGDLLQDRVVPARRVALGRVEHAVGRRRVCDDGDAQSSSDRGELLFDAAFCQRPLLLKGSDRMDGMGAPEVVGRDVGEADSTDLSLLYKVGHRTDGFLDGNGVAAMVQVVEVDAVGLKSPKAGFAGLTYVRGVGPDFVALGEGAVPDDPELARQYYL